MSNVGSEAASDGRLPKEQTRESLIQTVTSTVLGSPEFGLSEDLRGLVSVQLRADRQRVEVETDPEFQELMAAEQESARAQRLKGRVRYVDRGSLALAMLSVVYLGFYIIAAAFALPNPARAWGSYPYLIGALGLSMCIVWLSIRRILNTRISLMLEVRVSRLAVYRSALSSSISQNIRAYMATAEFRENRAHAKDEEERRRVREDKRFRPTSAPALVEIDAGSASVLDSDSVAAVREFIAEHRTSTVGLAGPRGSGKTTVLRQIVREADADKQLGIYLPVPVYYEPAEFVRVLHRAVVHKVLDSDSGPRVLQSRGLAAPLFLGLGMYFGALLIVLGVVLPVNSIDISKYANAATISGTIVASLTGYVAYARRLNRRVEVRRNRRIEDRLSLRELAESQMEKLDFASTAATKAKLAGKLWSVLSLETEKSVQLQERELSHPERVEQFRRFLLAHGELSGGRRVVIAIDELDKIADPVKAIDLVNGLKDLFHISNTHFCVSVSDDALVSFALRGVPVRDVFDSTFDEIVEVGPLPQRLALDLLARRVVDFPAPAALVCHALSGGLPRELIRLARTCVSCRRSEGESDIVDVVARVVVKRFQAIVGAFVTTYPELAFPISHGLLLSLMERLRQPAPFADSVIDNLGIAAHKANDIDGALPVELYALAVVSKSALDRLHELFLSPDWRKRVEEEEILSNFKIPSQS